MAFLKLCVCVCVSVCVCARACVGMIVCVSLYNNLLYLLCSHPQLGYSTCRDTFQATDTGPALGKAVFREDSKHIICTVSFSSWFRDGENICSWVESDLVKNSISHVCNGDYIREVFPFEKKRFTPCCHKAHSFNIDVQIKWRIRFSYIKGLYSGHVQGC